MLWLHGCNELQVPSKLDLFHLCQAARVAMATSVYHGHAYCHKAALMMFSISKLRTEQAWFISEQGKQAPVNIHNSLIVGAGIELVLVHMID